MSVGQGGERSVEDWPGIPNHLVQYWRKVGEAQTMDVRSDEGRGSFSSARRPDSSVRSSPPLLCAALVSQVGSGGRPAAVDGEHGTVDETCLVTRQVDDR